MRNLILLAVQGAGKGTLAKNLKEKYGYVHISTGDILRERASIDDELGRQIKSMIDNGQFVPNDIIFEAVEYMHESFSDPELTVDSIASKYGMSGTYFRRLFAERFSTTPLKYLNKLRFSLATELLLSNYYTVEEISERCGFNNVNYFSLFIKQRTGMPPSVYRRELLKTK